MSADLRAVRLSIATETPDKQKPEVIQHKDGILVGGQYLVNLSTGDRSGEKVPYLIYEIEELDPTATVRGSGLHVSIILTWGTFNKDKSAIVWNDGLSPEKLRLAIEESPTKRLDINFLFTKFKHFKNEEDLNYIKGKSKWEVYDMLARFKVEPEFVGAFVPCPNNSIPAMANMAVKSFKVGDRWVDSYTTFLWAKQMESTEAIALAFAQQGMIVYNRMTQIELNSPAKIEAERQLSLVSINAEKEKRNSTETSNVPTAEEERIKAEIQKNIQILTAVSKKKATERTDEEKEQFLNLGKINNDLEEKRAGLEAGRLALVKS